MTKQPLAIGIENYKEIIEKNMILQETLLIIPNILLR